jgi:hypothetical protein|tara:strand:- start:557 stop:904 length:348 start_codon:yes stop_codon:yes gene_type:complete
MAITFDWTSKTGSAYNKQTIATTVPQTLLTDQQIKGTYRGVVLFVFSTGVAGTLTVNFIDRDNNKRALQATSVASGTLSAIDFDFPLPRYEITWTSDSGTSSDVSVEVFPYGAGR